MTPRAFLYRATRFAPLIQAARDVLAHAVGIDWRVVSTRLERATRFAPLIQAARDRVARTLDAFRLEGCFRRDVEPRFAAISTIAQVVYFIVARPAIGVFFREGARGVPETTARKFGRHAGEFALRALTHAEQPK